MRIQSCHHLKKIYVLPSKSGICQNIAMRALPTARMVYLSCLPSRSIHRNIFRNPVVVVVFVCLLLFLTALVLADAVFRNGPQNRIGHPAGRHNLLRQFPCFIVQNMPDLCIITVNQMCICDCISFSPPMGPRRAYCSGVQAFCQL